MNYIEETVDELNREFPAVSIVLAGDFNQLSDHGITERTGLTQIVQYVQCAGSHICIATYVLYCTSCYIYYAQ